MAKYIDADLLIRKIKGQIRLETLNFAALGGGGQTFCINTLEWVLKQIDSLQQKQQEEPVPNDLEEYASRAGFDYVDNIVQEHPGHRFNDHDVEYAYRDGIIAGAKWQKEQDDKLVDTIYQQGIEKGKDEMRETLTRKKKK